MRMWRKGRRQRSAWISLPQEWIRQSQLNDLIWRVVKKAQIPASKDPSDYRGLTVNGPTERLWSRGLVANRSLGI